MQKADFGPSTSRWVGTAGCGVRSVPDRLRGEPENHAGSYERARKRRIGRKGRAAMIARLIRWSIENSFLVLLATLMVCAWGLWAMLKTPLDAIPDLSDVQVIIRTSYPGQAPQIVEDQVTYPLTTT